MILGFMGGWGVCQKMMHDDGGMGGLPKSDSADFGGRGGSKISRFLLTSLMNSPLSRYEI